MSDRHYHLRLSCKYESNENKIAELSVEVLDDNQWQDVELSTLSPGFFLFINGLFSCQHLYMRINCAECDLVLKSSTGELKITAGEFWNISKASISFIAKLKSGTPNSENINYITERMKHCPVSSNLPDNLEILTTGN